MSRATPPTGEVQADDMIGYFEGPSDTEIEVWLSTLVDSEGYDVDVISFIFFESGTPTAEVFLREHQLSDRARWRKLLSAHMGEGVDTSAFERWLLALVMRLQGPSMPFEQMVN